MQENKFETIKRLDDGGIEYCSSREIVEVLEYSEYRKFLYAID